MKLPYKKVIPEQTQTRLGHIEYLVEEQCRCGQCDERKHAKMIRFWARDSKHLL